MDTQPTDRKHARAGTLKEGSSSTLPVVAIGASAGGLEALERFFRSVPADLGVAFVVVVHLSPEHDSELASILSRYTSMPVQVVTSTQPLERNHVYVIPPDRKLEISDRWLAASAFTEPRGKRAPIDTFFRSLAVEHGDGFAVILSGGGSDGALGVRASKEAGAIVLVQDPEDAMHDGMPRAAIATGVADIVLPVRELAAKLAELVHTKQHVLQVLSGEPKLNEADEQTFGSVLALIRVRKAHDFSRYKRSTILRRLARRMQLQQKFSAQQYYDYLRDTPSELEALFDDLLISVTSFFRDPEAWSALEREVVAPVVESKRDDRPIRVWVAGCATGEEAYSIAILFLECLGESSSRADLTVFATDLDERALAVARDGVYPSTIAADISEARLRRFFRQNGNRYQVTRAVRDCVTFAAHSMLRDPPFSGLDLVTCRNVLIYLNPSIQEQVAAVFHYACRPGGYLFLGMSETAEDSMFRPVDKKHRIFQTRSALGSKPPALPQVLLKVPHTAGSSPRAISEAPLGAAAVHRELLEDIGPPSVLVDERRNVVHMSDNAGRFLRPRGGPLARDITELVRPELQLEVRSRLNRALDKQEPSISSPVTVSFDDTLRRVSVFVAPQPRAKKTDDQLALVLFLDAGVALPAATGPAPDGNEASHLLREEIRELEERMQVMLEDHRNSNEALRAANEELQSLNEEYRSTAEELETSKEELQSMNEELQTVNADLKVKFEEVSRANDDLENLMAATEIGTLFLDRALAIYRFTPRVADLFNFQSSDRGRFIGHFTHRLDYVDLVRDAEKVLETLIPSERRAQSVNGDTFMVRFRPYRTLQDRIDGVVITFFDVTALTHVENKLRDSERQLTEELRVSERLHELTMQAEAATSSHSALDEILVAAVELQEADFGMVQLLDAPTERLELVAQLGFDAQELSAYQSMAADGATSYGRVVLTRGRHVIDDVTLPPRRESFSEDAPSRVYGAVHSVPLISDDGRLLGVLSTQFTKSRTISERDKRVLDTVARQAANLVARWSNEESLVRLNEQLTQRSSDLNEQDKRKADFLAVLGHELRNPLAAIRSAVSVLELQHRVGTDEVETQTSHMLSILTRQSEHMTHMVNDLLDITRINHGKLRLNRRTIDLRETVRHSLASTRLRAGSEHVTFEVQLPEEPVLVDADPDRMLQIVDNLLSNAWHHSDRSTRIDVAVERVGHTAQLQVRDRGRGMTAEVIAKLFEPFFQAAEGRSSHEGLGLGLAVVRRLVEMHGGQIEARSEGTGHGSEFIASFPAVEVAPIPRAPSKATRRNWRVLVVDDQRDIADALGGLLKSLGHEVSVAYDAATALQRLHEFRPEVAILDLSMPTVSGYELAKLLRARAAGLRLFAMSGLEPGDRDRAAEAAGFERCLTKPPDIESLMSLLDGSRDAAT